MIKFSIRNYFKTTLIIAGILIFFFSCSKDVNSLSYFSINGTVKNDSSQPLENIRIIRNATDYLLFADTVYTDSLGKFSVSFSDYYARKSTFNLKIEDIDATANGGEFATQTVQVGFSSSDWIENFNANEFKTIAEKKIDITLLPLQSR